MQLKHIILFAMCSIILLGVAATVSATEHLPPGLLKIIEQNQKNAEDTLQNVSFLIAFFAGILTLLSPCVLPLLPAFFAYTFKEQKKITYMTIIFFLGFTVSFIVLGVIAAIIGDVSITLFQQRIGPLVIVAGIIMMGLGILTIFSKGFSGFPLAQQFSTSKWGIFVYGIAFALGWTVCVGPILVGVLLMASLLHNYVTAILLMFFYSLGMFVPLFLLSFFYDKYNLSQSKWIKGKELRFGEFRVHSTKLVAGLLLILTGVIFILLQGTGFINSIWYFGLKQYFYSLQDQLVQYSTVINVAGAIILIAMLYGVWFFTLKKHKS